MPRYITVPLVAACLAIIVSPTIAGFCARGAVLIWFYWLGILDADTTERLVIHGHF